MNIRTLVASAVVLAIPALTYAAPVTTENATITAIFGSGNPDTGWQQVADSATGLTLGLRAKDRNTGATPNNGAGTYSFASGTTWQIEFSVNNGGSSLTSPFYNYFLTINGSPVNLSTFDDNQYGNSSTANGAGTKGKFADLAGLNNIMQNSEKNSFAFINDTADGLYTFDLYAEDRAGAIVDEDTIHVQVGNPVPDSGAGIAGFAAIGLVLWAGRSKMARKSIGMTA